MNNVLKYPGSKWNIAKQLVELIPPHHSYVEPYFGSGALLFNKPPSAIETANDLDSDVVNVFECIQQDSERLARLVMTTPYSREEYDKHWEPDNSYASRYQRAAGFLVRCWQGYGFRTNGYKVGWKNDVQGRERAYALWNWYRLPEWIIDIAERLQQVQIENRPALEVIRRFSYPNVFIYIDPPYLLGSRASKQKQYKHEMTDSGHEELLKTILQSKAKIMISGYESDMYNDYLKGWHKETFSSCAEQGKPRQEIVWMNYKIKHTNDTERLGGGKMYEQLDIFSFLPQGKPIFKPGEYVEKDVLGERLTFDEITKEIGNLIIIDKSTQSHEWYEVVRVEKIVTVEGNQRRLVYHDGTRQCGLVDEEFFSERVLRPVRIYRIGM